MNWFVLALRNLTRNRRRSAVTVFAAALGFAAVNVFGGFTTYMFVNLRDAFIYAGGNGHLQVYREGYKEHATSDPAGYLLPGSVYAKLQALTASDDRILLVTGTMELTGQIDTGDAANIFIAKAFQPSHRDVFFREATTLNRGVSFIDAGEALTDDNPNEIGAADGVLKVLGLELGADVVLMSRTVGGQINVVDAVVKNSFASPNAEIAEKLIVVPLELAQSLYQTDAVGSVSVLLKDRRDLAAVREVLKQALADEDQPYRVAAWDEESDLYQLTKKMFNMIFGMVFCILIVIVSMSVMNTMGMAIIERTTEIGTLRAIGFRRSGIIGLFGMEGTLLGIGGSLLGAAVTAAVWLVIRWQNPMWRPPTIGREVPLEIRLEPAYLLMTTGFLIVLTLAAAIIPARKASRQGIVEALGHV